MKLKIIGIILVTLTSFLCSCQLKSDKSLSEKVEVKFEAEGETIDLSDLSDFEWDNILILGPYSNIQRIENELKLDLSNIKENGIQYNDSFNLIVFLNDNESVKIIELRRTSGDFKNTNELIPKDKTKFVITKTGIKLIE